jgi:hypothetical protein
MPFAYNLVGKQGAAKASTGEPGPAAVFHFGTDDALLRVWWRRGGIAKSSLVDRSITLVAPGFSTWAGEAPFAHLTAIFRSFYWAAVAARTNPVIPTLPLTRSIDLDTCVEFLGLTGDGDLAVDLWAKTDMDWLELLSRLTALRGVSGPDLRLVVNGVFAPHRLAAVVDLWGTRLVIASKRPLAAALYGGERLDENLRPSVDFSMSRHELCAVNATVFEGVVRSLLDARWRRVVG